MDHPEIPIGFTDKHGTVLKIHYDYYLGKPIKEFYIVLYLDKDGKFQTDLVFLSDLKSFGSADMSTLHKFATARLMKEVIYYKYNNEYWVGNVYASFVEDNVKKVVFFGTTDRSFKDDMPQIVEYNENTFFKENPLIVAHLKSACEYTG